MTGEKPGKRKRRILIFFALTCMGLLLAAGALWHYLKYGAVITVEPHDVDPLTPEEARELRFHASFDSEEVSGWEPFSYVPGEHGAVVVLPPPFFDGLTEAAPGYWSNGITLDEGDSARSLQGHVPKAKRFS